jgi:replication factor C subunit 2/4
MNEPFLKKYKPKRYKDFVIDPEYINLLSTLVKMDSLNILLIGDSSCGKTSLLDATIREYYDKDYIPRDNVLYINNLQEQGISYYRTEVKTFCKTPSSISGKKKFIVLDDIDIINDQSQQVFRNCIDKYSHNVSFISSCTNTQKVVESLQSRCTLIKIKSVETKLLSEILTKIKRKEGIKITKKAQEFILNVCNNSIRLLVNYMEKFNLLDEKITLEKAKNICTNISYYDFEKFTNEWYNNKNLSTALKVINTIFDKGYSVMDILDSYFQFVKITNILNEEAKYKSITIICSYISLFHTLHEDEIELVFFTYDLVKSAR